MSLQPGYASSLLVVQVLEALPFTHPRLVVYPANQSLGTLHLRDWDDRSASWEPFGEAIGAVEVPTGKEFSFSAHYHRDQDEILAWFRNLGTEDLQHLTL